jgi:arylsulfatase A-like enzyme
MVPKRMLVHYPSDAPASQPQNNYAPVGVPPVGWTYSGELSTYNYNVTQRPWLLANGTGLWEGLPNTTMPTEWAAELRRHYFAAVSATDELLGSIFDELAAQGIADNTLIAFIGDHGRWLIDPQ